MANEGIELEIYPYNDPTGPAKWVLPGRKKPQVLDEIKAIGGGSFFIPKNDPKLVADPSILDSRNICKVKVNGIGVGAFFIGGRESSIIDSGERSAQGYQLAGEGLKSWFNDATVKPHGGLRAESAEERYFNFASPERGVWYDSTKWIPPYYLGRVITGGPAPWRGYPKKWPDNARNAQWVWGSPYQTTMPTDPIYVRWEIGQDGRITPGVYALYVSADDQFIVFVDGEQVAKSNEKNSARYEASRVEITLSSGIHTIAFIAQNRKAPGYNGPGGLAFALERVGLDEKETLIGTSTTGYGDIKILPYPTSVPGWSVGEVLLTLLDEAESRGVLFPTYLNPTFTAELDSYGKPWTEKLEWVFKVGESYSTVLSKIEELYDVWIDTDFNLHMVPIRGKVHDVNSDTPIRFFMGKHLQEASTSVGGNIKNSLDMKTTEGWTTASDATSVSKYGRLESAMSTEADTAFSNKLAQLVFDKKAQEEVGASYKLTPTTHIPFVDFGVGDWVLAPSERGDTVLRRVMSISVEETDAGKVDYTIEFDTIFRDAEDRLNRVVSKLSGGGVGGGLSNAGGITPGGGGGIILPPTNNQPIITPSAPTNVIADSIGYWTADGVTTLSEVTVSWDPVTTDTDGIELIPQIYEVYGQQVNDDSGVQAFGSTSATSLSLTNFVPGDVWEFWVIAVSIDGIPSEPSTRVTEAMVGPNLPMAAPSKPTGSSDLGLLTLNWDGNLSNGQVPPRQYRYTYVEIKPSASGEWTKVSTVLQRDGRQVTITGLIIGTAYVARYTAVDGRGVESPKSSVSDPITITGIDLGNLNQDVTDAIQAAQDAANAASQVADDAQTAANLAQGLAEDAQASVATMGGEVNQAIADAASALATANSALATADGMITWSPSAPVTADGAGKPIDAVWYRTSANGIIGQWRWNGTAWTTSPIDSDAIYSINAVKITAGTLDAARIAANSITAAKLLIGNFDNQVPDPQFLNVAVSGWNNSNHTLVVGGGRSSATNALRITGTGAQKGAYNPTNIPVREGDIYRISVWVKSSIALPASSNLLAPYFQIDRLGTTQTTGGLNNATAIPANTWVKVESTFTIPASGYQVRVGFYAQPPLTSGATLDFTEPEMIRISDATLIQDGAITTDKVAANAVTAAKILAGTITGDKIAAGTISTSKMTITSLENLVEDGSFEYSTATGLAWTYAGGAISDTVNPRTGARALKVTTTASAFVAAASVAAFQVEEGQTYRVEGWVRLDSGAVANNGLTLRFKHGTSEASTPTASSDIAVTTPDTTTTYAPLTGVWTVPAGAKWARVEVVSREVTAGKVYRLDDLAVYKMTTGELIVDGTITASKIGAEQIVAEHIQASTIDTPHLRAGAVTTEILAAGSVTANELAANAVEANNILAGAVQTNHLSPAVGNEINLDGNVTIVATNDRINEVSDDLDVTSGNLEEMQTYYSFGPDGAVISSPGSVFATAIRNDRIEMLENGNVISYWNKGQMFVDQLIGSKVTLGRHQIERFDVNGTVVRAL